MDFEIFKGNLEMKLELMQCVARYKDVDMLEDVLKDYLGV